MRRLQVKDQRNKDMVFALKVYVYFAAAALGIIFDTTNYDKDVSKETVAVIDQFFESLKYDSNDPTPDVIHYG